MLPSLGIYKLNCLSPSCIQRFRYRFKYSCYGNHSPHPDDGLRSGVGDDQEVQGVVVVHLESRVDPLEEVLGPTVMRPKACAIDKPVAAIGTLCSGRANAYG